MEEPICNCPKCQLTRHLHEALVKKIEEDGGVMELDVVMEALCRIIVEIMNGLPSNDAKIDYQERFLIFAQTLKDFTEHDHGTVH